MGRNRLVVVIDPDADSRAQTVDVLRDAPYAVIGEAGYGAEATSLVAETQPEVVLIAVSEPVENGLQTIESLAETYPGTPLVTYSQINDMQTIRRVMKAGVRDMLPQPLQRDELMASMDSIEPSSREQLDDAATPPVQPRREQTGKVLTVFGAKGGIGKSTIATNLGSVIARDTDCSVLVMDMDTRFGDIAIMLDIEPQFTIADLALSSGSLDRDTFMRALMEHESGARILAAPKHPSEWGNVSAEQMQEIVKFGARHFDYVILDTPGTFNDIVATSIELADRVLVVSSLDMASIKDTVHMLDLLEAEGFPEERLLLVINQVNRATTVKPADVPRIVHKDVFWSIPYDEQVLLANSIGQPIVIAKPKSGAAKQLRGLALKVETGQAELAKAPRRSQVA
jgi:pilus assembly protein CpaE